MSYIYIYTYIYKGLLLSLFMKVQKLFTIDYELLDRLKDTNASALINSLLMKHYNDYKTEEEIIADVKAKLKAEKDAIDNMKRIADRIKKRTKEMRRSKNGS